MRTYKARYFDGHTFRTLIFGCFPNFKSASEYAEEIRLSGDELIKVEALLPVKRKRKIRRNGWQ